MTPLQPFSELKRIVSIEQVLAHRRLLASLQRRGDLLVGPCPVHRGDNPRAFVAQISKGLWHCFTRCQRGGDVIELVRLLDGIGYAETARRLAAMVLHATTQQGVLAPPAATRQFRPFSRRLVLDANAAFVAAKGIRVDTAARFDSGAFNGAGWLEGCVAVRLHDPQVVPLGYAGRQLHPARISRYGKWKLPPLFPRSSTLYNLHRVRPQMRRGIVVVECPWGVMRLDQIGVPAVALLGTHLSVAQRQLLADATRILLLMDGDQAGEDAARRIRATLPQGVNVALVRPPDGHDPDDLDDHQLRALTESFHAPRGDGA